MNEREILARLEAANAAEIYKLLSRPTTDEARIYRTYFGSERYEELRRKTLGGSRTKRAPKRGNLLILHGIMGGELTVFDKGKPRPIWLNIIQMLFGGVGWLRMDNGKSTFDVRATGILKKWYAEQILELSADWNTQVYWYDWRRDIDEIADDLRLKIDGWFGDSAAVNLVAHSMGGLVSRTYIARHPARWKKGGKLIMLGTPNHGSFAIPQVITGVIDTVQKLERLDLKHNRAQFTEILAGLPGSLQMLPSPLVMPAMDALYRSSETWGGRVPQGLLDRARSHHDFLAEVVDGTRMHYIAGSNRRTYDDICRWDRLDALEGYSASMNGDGTVPHRLGYLEQNGKRIPTWYVEEDHGALPNNSAVINAVETLLLNDNCDLPTVPNGGRSLVADRSAAEAVAPRETAKRLVDEARLDEIAARLRSRTRSADNAENAFVSRDEIEAQEIVLRSFLAGESAKADSGRVEPSPQVRKSKAKAPAAVKIELALLRADLADLFCGVAGAVPVDAVAVGHYIGVTPQYAELALDRAVSDWKRGDSDDKLLITSLHKRGSLPAQLGQVFVLPAQGKSTPLAVLAGMGEPGTFGTPQLTVAVRELAWAMGRLKRQHLASVLIGAGVGNLAISAAVRAWLRGLRRALYDARAPGTSELKRLTLFDLSPETFLRIHQAIEAEIELIGPKFDPEPLEVNYNGPDDKALEDAKVAARSRAVRHAKTSIEREFSRKKSNGDTTPMHESIRFTARLINGTYEFSVLGSDASIPQRNVRVDPVLIAQINDQIPIAANHRRQRDLGNLLGRMLIPTEIRGHVIKPDVPTVLAVDATTARIHFETAALSPAAGSGEFDPNAFIGTAANLTRQLRTTFAPLPEPPIVSGRTLRVLVVADPCEEAPLPGAQEEGEAVAQIFERQRSAELEIEVVRLFGPAEATRVSVLDCLINQRFDILHYAGHCYYNGEDPSASGWLFSNHEVLSACELDRIDRIPRFVFSNACESGVTPDRADKRSAGMAPSFAETFFSRGVANFICTAWPVDDAAALAFATRVYEKLLAGAEPLHTAIGAARSEIAKMGDGGRATWAAYQHYGDPFFRIA